jgi:hypothetical protein
MASTDPAEPIAADELHECYREYVRTALARGGGDERQLLAQIEAGQLLLCWSDPWLAFRASGMAGAVLLNRLVDALRWQAEDYDRDGLNISARDCLWLAAKLTGGALQLATLARVDEAREAQAAQRRGRDLDRWQQQAEARAAAR